MTGQRTQQVNTEVASSRIGIVPVRSRGGAASTVEPTRADVSVLDRGTTESHVN
jgi:hypothetical protein